MPARSPLRTVLKASLTTCSVLTHLGPVVQSSTTPAACAAHTRDVSVASASEYRPHDAGSSASLGAGPGLPQPAPTLDDAAHPAP